MRKGRPPRRKSQRAPFARASVELGAESCYFLIALKASVWALMPRSAARRSIEVAPKKPSMPGTCSMTYAASFGSKSGRRGR